MHSLNSILLHPHVHENHYCRWGVLNNMLGLLTPKCPVQASSASIASPLRATCHWIVPCSCLAKPSISFHFITADETLIRGAKPSDSSKKFFTDTHVDEGVEGCLDEQVRKLNEKLRQSKWVCGIVAGCTLSAGPYRMSVWAGLDFSDCLLQIIAARMSGHAWRDHAWPCHEFYQFSPSGGKPVWSCPIC